MYRLHVVRECPTCHRKTIDTDVVCLVCGQDLRAARFAPAPGAPGPQSEFVSAPDSPTVSGEEVPGWFRERHPNIELFAWLVWALALLGLTAFVTLILAALREDNRVVWGLLIGFAIFLATAPSVILVTTALAMRLRRRDVQTFCGMALWFLAIPILSVWCCLFVASRFSRQPGIPNALRAMNRLATSSILTFAFVAFSIGGFAGVPLVLAWLLVLIWAPVSLVKARRQVSAASGAPGSRFRAPLAP